MKAATVSRGYNSVHQAFQSTPPVKAATNRVNNILSVTEFQSTPPVKAATSCTEKVSFSDRISIHAAREGGDGRRHPICGYSSISIHAAREGGDPSVAAQPFASAIFQSTPPVKAATICLSSKSPFAMISIHAAREGGDAARQGVSVNRHDFNPRRP